ARGAVGADGATKLSDTKWHHRGTVVAPWRHRGGTIVAPWWHHRGTVGTVVAPSWHHRGTIVAPWPVASPGTSPWRIGHPSRSGAAGPLGPGPCVPPRS